MKPFVRGLVLPVAVSAALVTFDTAVAYGTAAFGDCARWQDYPERSVVACTKLIQEITPANVAELSSLYEWRGAAYGQMGDYRRAMADFNKALEARRRLGPPDQPVLPNFDPWYP